MSTRGLEFEETVEVVAQRVEFIDLLESEGPLAPRDVVEELDYSRSTVTRALRSLQEADLVEKTDGGYTATLPGVLAAEQYRQYRTGVDAVVGSKAMLEAIPVADAPPAALFVDGTIVRADQSPVKALEAVAERVRNADSVVAFLPTLLNTHLLRMWHRLVVSNELSVTALLDPDLSTELQGQYPKLLSEMATTEHFSAATATGPPYSIVLTSTDGTATVTVIVYEANTAVRGIVSTDSTEAVEWARDELAAIERDADDVTADLEAVGAAVTDGS